MNFLKVFCGISAVVWGVSASMAFPVEVANAPTDNLALTVSAITGAQHSLSLNIYELTSPEIQAALINRIQAGVTVKILEEGQPVGGFSAAARGVQSQIALAMKNSHNSNNHFYEMTSLAGGTRRFHFDHGKYAVIDDSKLLIGSENYSPTGNPQAGSLGNRGWEVLISDVTTAQNYLKVFTADTNLSSRDVRDITSSATSGSAPNGSPSTGPSSSLPNAGALEAMSVTQITSPDSSLSGLTHLIQSATHTIDLEQMTFDSAWGPGQISPLYTALVEAARRGVKVRILLNDDKVFAHPGRVFVSKNKATQTSFDQVAAQEHLPLTTLIANLSAMGVDYIHNKGMLVDGNIALISSINWDQNSVLKNREAAVAINSPSVFQYYENLFNSDWSKSSGTASSKRLEVAAFQCPDQLSVKLAIGALSRTDAEDNDFDALANQTIRSSFERIDSASDCVLTSSSGAYLQIKSAANGKLGLELEGYTPAHHKLYSVRVALTDASFSTTLNAKVYDGSGPGRELLGTAVINFATTNLSMNRRRIP
jgi:phosphatidylserine/phosphatidylglycerophosphate/cardiolipin synthase-like enzyme